MKTPFLSAPFILIVFAFLSVCSLSQASLVLYLNLDETSGTAIDRSGHGINGILHNGLARKQSMAGFGKALEFDGVDDYLEIPLKGAFPSFTIAWWQKPASLINYNQGISGKGFFCHGEKGGGWYMGTLPGTDRIEASDTAGALRVGEWAHHAYIYNGATKTGSYYKGGALMAQKHQPPPAAFDGLLFGKDSSETIHGQVDDIAFWDAALSDADIAALAKKAKSPLDPMATATPMPTPRENSELPAEVFTNVGDYAYMWWRDGVRDPCMVYNIQTNRYGLQFDARNFTMPRFEAIAHPASEAEALVQDHCGAGFQPAHAGKMPAPQSGREIESLGKSSISCVVEAAGKRYASVGAAKDVSQHPIVESGKFFNRRVSYGIRYADEASIADEKYRSSHSDSSAIETTSTLEIAAWPDRVAFVYRVAPFAALKNSAMEIQIGVPEKFSTLLENGAGKVLAENPNGGGYCFFANAPGDASELRVDPKMHKAIVRCAMGNWTAGEEKEITLVVYPVAAECQKTLAEAVISETKPLALTAFSIAHPEGAVPIKSSYDPGLGWYRIDCPNDGAKKDDAGNDYMERVSVSVTNPDAQPRAMRLNFANTGQVYHIEGGSPMIRGEALCPTGIPVQISKVWGVGPGTPPRYNGLWFQGLTMLTVPAKTTLTFEYTRISPHWGGLPAASHAQLCIIGDRAGQLWNETALGAWGENICYDPDVNLQLSMIDDVRPLMVWSMNNDEKVKWSWTNNVGGGDFLVYFDETGKRLYNIRMKVMYARYCPNLTEAVMAGTSGDGKINLKANVSLYRTDDIVRGIYKVRYDVTDPVKWKRLAFLQIGADSYNAHMFNKLARGNDGGMIEEWTPVKGGAAYSRKDIACEGTAPWISMHQSSGTDKSKSGAWANRGLVIRRYSARMNGRINNTPYASIFGTDSNMIPSCAVEISPAPDVEQLIAGDYIEMEAVQVTVPQFQRDYYGPNKNLSEALGTMQDTWKMIHREAVGNDIAVTATSGKVIETYPTKIRSANGTSAQFTITGGLGYLPVTIANLKDYRNPILETKSNGEWKAIDQSVFGKDFWQANYNASEKRWELTFNVASDQPGDARKTMDYRIEMNK